MSLNSVRFVDLKRGVAALEPELSEAIRRVLSSGTYLLGPEVAAFETEFAAFCGRRHAVGVASGTDALRLALVAMGIGPGDEVIVPAFTAVPTAAAVCAAGAVPVFADVEPSTGTVDPAAVRLACTDRTRAVIPVHLYGRPASVPELGVPILEDAAQAHGSVDSRSSAKAATYSFYPTKNLGGLGDGGAVVTDDDGLAARVRLLRNHGAGSDYLHTEVATNSRMSELEAAALRVGLTRLREGNDRRRAIASFYRNAAPALGWQDDHPRHAMHLCVLRTPNRTTFRERVSFETAVHYPRALPQQPAYARFVTNTCPEAEAWAAECVSLPCRPDMTDAEIEFVAQDLARVTSWSIG